MEDELLAAPENEAQGNALYKMMDACLEADSWVTIVSKKDPEEGIIFELHYPGGVHLNVTAEMLWRGNALVIEEKVRAEMARKEGR